MSDTVGEVRDDLNDLAVKLQRQIDSLNRDVITLAETVKQLLDWQHEDVKAQLHSVKV